MQDGRVASEGRAEDVSIWLRFVFADTDGRGHNLLPKHVLIRLNTKPQSRWSQNNKQLKKQEVLSLFLLLFILVIAVFVTRSSSRSLSSHHVLTPSFNPGVVYV